jgi:hypothetical protein
MGVMSVLVVGSWDVDVDCGICMCGDWRLETGEGFGAKVPKLDGYL